MPRLIYVPLVMCGLVLAFASPLGGQPPNSRPHLVVVQMVDRSATQFQFKPARVAVQLGDTLRFVQTGPVPHNVQFKKSPSGATLGAAVMGPFLLTKGQTYDVVIDERFVTGKYEFVCTPHETLGMKGIITVSNRTSSHTI